MSEYELDPPDLVSEQNVEGPHFIGNEHIDSIGKNLLASLNQETETNKRESVDSFDSSGLDEQRRIAALNVAQSIQHDNANELLSDASLIEDFLKTGKLPDVNLLPVLASSLTTDPDHAPALATLPQDGPAASPGVTGEGQP